MTKRDACRNIAEPFSFSASTYRKNNVNPAETGLYYLQSRYYDPEVGRFLNADNVESVANIFDGRSYSVFSYCSNEPVNDIDSDGGLSLHQVKQAFRDVVDGIKCFFTNIIDYVKSKFQYFISKTSAFLNNGILGIKTNLIGYVIDALVNTIIGVVKGTAISFGLKFFKMWWKVHKSTALREFVFKTILPMLKSIDWLIENFLSYLKRRFATKLAIEITKGKIEDAVFSGFNYLRWISAFTSVGSFIAAILDILDGRFDDMLCI